MREKSHRIKFGFKTSFYRSIFLSAKCLYPYGDKECIKTILASVVQCAAYAQIGCDGCVALVTGDI